MRAALAESFKQLPDSRSSGVRRLLQLRPLPCRMSAALIAFLSKPELTKLFQNRALPKHNPNTICSLQSLELHLGTVRANGFAVDDEEHELGVRCIAAPIFNFLGKPIASICVFGPTYMLPNRNLKALGSEVASATSEITRHLSQQVGSLRPDFAQQS